MSKFSTHIDPNGLRDIGEKMKIQAKNTPDRIDQASFSVKYEEIKNSIKSVEKEWDNKPIDFLQRDHAQRYIDGAYNALDAIKKYKEKIFQSYLSEIKELWVDKEAGVLFFIFNFLIPSIGFAFISAFILLLIFGKSSFLTLVIGVIMYLTMTVFFYARRKEKLYEKFDRLPMQKEYKSDLEDVDKMFDILSARINTGKNEMFANADFNQSLLNQIKSRQVDAHFNEQQSKQLLMDRMEIMKLEIEKARKITEDLTEQHRATEEIRIKYAREMMELEQQLKVQSDKDLYEKMEALKKMMEG